MRRETKRNIHIACAIIAGVCFVMFVLTVGGCGTYERRHCYSSGNDCSSEEVSTETTTIITGPSGPAGPSGPSGPAGERGERGETGASGPVGPMGPSGQDGSVGPSGATGIQGPEGQSGPVGATGPAGAAGPVGPPGEAGTSCSVSPYTNGALISCTDGTSVVLLDGVDEVDGTDAVPSPYMIVGFIDPCGPQGSFDEVLMQLDSGQLIAHYSHGNRQFLVSLPPGNYTTTDGTSCSFVVHSDMSVTW